MRSGLLYGYRRGHDFRKDYQIFQQKDEANGFFDRLVLLSKITIWKSLEILILWLEASSEQTVAAGGGVMVASSGEILFLGEGDL